MWSVFPYLAGFRCELIGQDDFTGSFGFLSKLKENGMDPMVIAMG
ncbi:hypothetical protein TRICHSKD4_3626 [Roseibium sp. TrichSKD4]|nr:hypothetical protein TRICHSKD4_3626 [Roseibium sp. TrichSKD4]